MAGFRQTSLVIDGQQFDSLSKACNYYDISYRDLRKISDKNGISKEEALEQLARDRKNTSLLMRRL